MKVSAIRLTLFAIISSSEQDLRWFLKENLIPLINTDIFGFDIDLKH